MNDSSVQKRCIQFVSETLARTKGCQDTEVDKTFCERQLALQEAMVNHDLETCLALGENKQTCEERLTILSTSFFDQDQDGLSSQEEELLGTSDREEDTDHDGFTDRQEVEAGYNPNGDGKLP
jgi:hypothetical protein